MRREGAMGFNSSLEESSNSKLRWKMREKLARREAGWLFSPTNILSNAFAVLPETFITSPLLLYSWQRQVTYNDTPNACISFSSTNTRLKNNGINVSIISGCASARKLNNFFFFFNQSEKNVKKKWDCLLNELFL